MSRRADHEEWYELVAGHVLHALDEVDEARLQRHLLDCADCRAELDEQALTASHLASLADDASIAPPPWASIRDAVVDTAPPAPVDLSVERRSRRPATQWLMAAAATVVVLAGAAVASWQVLRSDGSGGSAPAALVSCAGLNGCQEVDLRSSGGVRRAAVIVDDGAARVQPLALGKAASGRTFVLWQLPRGGAPIALGEFASPTTASSAARLAVPMTQTTGFAVSSEPAGVPPKAPSDVLALGGVTS